MVLTEFRDRLAGTRLLGDSALKGDSCHLSRLRNTFRPFRVRPDVRFDRRLFALAFSNRSGSTYLGHLLASTPDLYGFREDLNHNIVAKRVRTEGLEDFSSYLEHIVGLRATPDAGFGVKASAEQLRLIRMTGMDRAFDGTTVIRIRRRDRVAQAVSLWMAWKTGQWTSRQDARAVRLTYDYQALRKSLQSVQEAESALDLILSALPYPVLNVDYERLCENPASTLAALRSDLGLPALPVEKDINLERQISEDKAAFVRRFREDLSRAWGLPRGDPRAEPLSA